jgi:hypothetical protein
MAIEQIVIREGTTAPIVLQLLADGIAIDLNGIDHVRLDMLDINGAVYRYSSSDVPQYLVITNASTGTVSFLPPSENVFRYQKSPYKLYVWVYTTSTTRYSVPENESYKCQIVVIKEY